MRLMIKYGGLASSIFVLIGIIVSSIEGFLLPQTIRLVITGLENGSKNELIFGVCYGIIGFLVVGIGSYFFQFSIVKLIKHFNVNVKSMVYNHYMQTYQRDSESKSSDVISFIQNDFKLLENNYIVAWISALQTILLATVASGYILFIDIKLGLLFIAFALFTLLLPMIYRSKIERKAKSWSEANEIYTNELLENIKGIETILGYQREKTFLMRLKNSITNVEDKNIKMVMIQALSNLSAYVLSYILSLIPVLIGGFFVFKGSLDLGALVAVFIASNRIANPISVSAHSISKLSATIDIRNKIIKIEEEVDLFKQTGNTLVDRILPIKIKNGTVQFANNLVLKDFNLEINKGEKLLLLGESGSGKTTILNLIQRHIYPTSGHITFDNNETLINHEIISNISYIRQTPMIFNETLEFNITLGEYFEKDKLNNAIEAAGLKTIVKERGLDYIVGENGKNLSGGQNQRVEIARAILRERELLIADEVTSSLDKETAENIHSTLLNLPQAVIEVSHHIKEEDFNKYDHVYLVKDKNIKLLNSKIAIV
jgi:ABC-type multidrug transport system fused ATPase/permease subunit